MVDQAAGAPRPMAGSRRISAPMGAGESWLNRHWYDAASNDPSWPDIHVYTDAMSYAPGDEVQFRASTQASSWTLEIVRDGAHPRRMHLAPAIAGQYTACPDQPFRTGCDWPVLHRWRIPADCRSGFFKVISHCDLPDGARYIHHHFFVVRPARDRPAAHLLILPTATWTAYNDWGGANHYQGIAAASAILSLKRPWRNGLVWLPEGSPRIASDPERPIGAPPQYRMKEWALANGFGQYAGAAGWAQFDRHFLVWAETHGFDIDIITQTDLQYRPEILAPYRCLVFVGHDEYWSAAMRDAVDAFVDAGGHVARFAGNFLWQIRLEDEGQVQVCHKYNAASADTDAVGAQAHLLTTAWEDRRVGRPGASTFGVNALRGMYAGWGGFAPAGGGGFTIYRPRHWAFDGTYLRYGDMLGRAAQIFGYEVDGLEYDVRNGLPYPLGTDGAPEGLEILGMAPATLEEDVIPGDAGPYYIRDGDLRFAAEVLDGEATPENMARRRHGSGMMVSFRRGKGEVFTAGSCEWIMGLSRRDPQVEQITGNVLRRFGA